MTRLEHVFPDHESNMELLHEQLAALGLPDLEGIYRFINPPGPRLVLRCGPLTANQLTAVTSAIASHDASQRTAAQQVRDAAMAADATERAALAAILSKADGDVTAAEVKTLVLRLARRLQRAGAI